MIPGQAFPVDDLFKESLAVPDFQRDYVWDAKRARRLLQDILEFSTDPMVKDEDKYFIGSIVLKEDSNGYSIIDGQQRITTLFLSILALRSHLLSLDPSYKVAHITSKLLSYEDSTSEQVERPRLNLIDEHCNTFLKTLIEGDRTVSHSETKQVKSIRLVYEALEAWADEQLGLALDVTKQFYVILLKRVTVLAYIAKGEAEAVRVFQVLNARAKALSQADLVKSLLFKSLPNDKYARLRQSWEKIMKDLDAVDEKPDRFLTYFILAKYGEAIRASGLYSWFEENAAITGHKNNAIGFVEELADMSRKFKHIASGNSTDGSLNPSLVNITKFSSSARQHLMLSFSAYRLDPTQQRRIAHKCEAILFLSQIVGEHTRENERRFTTWSVKMKSVTSDSDFEGFMNSLVQPELDALAAAAIPKLADLGERPGMSSYKARCAYVCARVARYQDVLAQNRYIYEIDTSYYLDNDGYQLEHILPQKPKQPWVDYFDQPLQIDAYIGRLGNLTYVLGSQNGSFKNSLFESKKQHYEASDVIMTRSIVRSAPGGDTGLTRAYALFTRASEWKSSEIDHRQTQLISALLKSYGV